MRDSSVALYAVHSEAACAERTEWCKTTLGDMATVLGAACAGSRVLGDDDGGDERPTGQAGRLAKHAAALRDAVQSAAPMALVMEDDTVVVGDVVGLVGAFEKSGDEVWHLTGSATAYILTTEACRRLLAAGGRHGAMSPRAL
jgi:hypothetical protein